MKQVFEFVKKHALTLLLLVGVLLGVRWVVVAKRGPGSMTVVEAQGMDMAAMRAPVGTFPVKTDHALEREVGGTETFPATVVAYSDEDVVARVAGLVKDVLVYPGDRVVGGQLLATLQADELSAMALKDSFEAQAMTNTAKGAEELLRHHHSEKRRVEYELDSAIAAEESATAEVQAMEASVASATEAVNESNAMFKEAEASLNYARLNFERKKALYEKGAVARNDLDMAQKEVDEASARVNQAHARAQISQKELSAMQSKLKAAKGMSKQAAAGVDAARAAVGESMASIAQAEEDLKAMKSRAASSSAGARSSGAMASYTQLRASTDGIVTERVVSPGTPVMMGETILRVKAVKKLRVQADLPQRLAGKVGDGAVVRIVVNDKSFEAKVTSVFPFIESATRSFRIEALLNNASRELQAGSFAEIEVVTSPKTRGLSVRRSAVKTASDGSHYVWVVKHKEHIADAGAEYTCTMHPQVRQKGPGKCPICKMDLVPVDATGSMFVEKRVVKVGAIDSMYAAILDGLDEGDEVTFEGDADLFPGASISISTDAEDAPMKTEVKEHDSAASPEKDVKKVASTMTGHEGHLHDPDDKFTCEMHPEVHKAQAGKCPVCKMDLVPIKDK